MSLVIGNAPSFFCFPKSEGEVPASCFRPWKITSRAAPTLQPHTQNRRTVPINISVVIIAQLWTRIRPSNLSQLWAGEETNRLSQC